MNKKLLSLFLAVTLILISVATFALADPAPEDFTYTVEDGKATITKYNAIAEGVFTVPDELDGYPVVAISENAFSYQAKMSEIILPDTVTHINDLAFSYSSIESITFSENVESIGEYVFTGCDKLKSINVDENNETFSCDEAGILFNKDKTLLIKIPGATEIVEYTIPETVEKIAIEAASGATKLETVIFPDGLKIIDNMAFYNCTSLTVFSIPSSVEFIGQNAFKNTAFSTDEANQDEDGVLYLDDVLLSCNATFDEEGVYEIKDGTRLLAFGAFFRNQSLKKIILPQSLTKIAAWSFRDCTKLSDVVIPDTIVEIGESAFNGCHSITEIQIPASVKTIGKDAFYGCEGLVEVTVPATVEALGSSVFASCTSLEKAIFEEGAKTTGSTTFYMSRNLKEVILPDSIEEIGDYAFYRTGLESIVIPEGVTQIKEGTFMGCTKLTAITIPTSVTVIEPFAFCECETLSVKYMGTPEEWEAIEISEDNNAPLLSAEIEYTLLPVYSPGDLDGDGTIDTSDVLIILHKATGLIELNEELFAFADINHDEDISSDDALIVLKYITGFIDEF